MLNDRQVLAILRLHQEQALGQDGTTGRAGSGSDLQDERNAALDAYHGRPVGTLQGPDGIDRSSVVSKDILDTVEWIIPQLLRIFISDDVVDFDPTDITDEDLAKQESDVVNHVFLKEAKGFIVLLHWFKDTLLQKNGYIHVTWEDQTSVSVEDYTGLNELQVALLFQELAEEVGTAEDSDEAIKRLREGIEIIEQEEKAGKFDLKIRITTKRGKVIIQGVPPEDMLVTARPFISTQDANYIGHQSFSTRSDLILDGHSKELVGDLPRHQDDFDEDEITRNTQADESNEDLTEDSSMDEIRIFEEYIRMDVDEDGIAELRRVIRTDSIILENDETDIVPYAFLTAVPMPHRHTGLSIYDLLKDLQEIKTNLWRQLIDNAVNANHPGHLYDLNKVDDPDELAVDRPRRLVGINGDVNNAVAPLQTESIINRLIPAIDLVDKTAEKRSGGSGASLAIDPSVLTQSTKGAFSQGLSAANQRIESIARIFAETGMKDLYWLIHAMLVKHQDFRRSRKIRNQWIDVDPRSWKKRDALSINVGLGNNSPDEVRQNLQMLAQIQERAAQAGIVTPENAFNLAEDLSAALGFKKSKRYFTRPEDLPPPEPQTNPLAEVEQIRQEANSQREIVKQTEKSREADMLHAREIAKLELEHERDIAEPGIASELNDAGQSS